MGRTLLTILLLASAACRLGAQPAQGESLPLADIKAGQRGEVWTVFQGTKPEPFAVEVAGIIQNSLGRGRSMSLCRLTDPRVQNMGAVAGMSGSPLYIDGRFAGAMSYQIQRFETVRYAGFTPAADMTEVADRVGARTPAAPQEAAPLDSTPPPDSARDSDSAFRAMNPVFALGGVSPRVASIMAPHFAALGIGVIALGGSSQGRQNAGAQAQPAAAVPALQPGDAISVALATGDISLAGTGTVSQVDGNRVVAFGHPMLGLGDVQLPMCSAEVVAILPSNLESVKVANVGPVIGCISEDRRGAANHPLPGRPRQADRPLDHAHGHRRVRFRVKRQRARGGFPNREHRDLLPHAAAVEGVGLRRPAGFRVGRFRLPVGALRRAAKPV